MQFHFTYTFINILSECHEWQTSSDVKLAQLSC